MFRLILCVALMILPAAIARAEAPTPDRIAAAIRAQGGEAGDAVILGGDYVMYGQYDRQGFKVRLHGCDHLEALNCDKVEMTSCSPADGDLMDAVNVANAYNQTHEIATAFTDLHDGLPRLCMRFTSLHGDGRDFGNYELVFWRQTFATLNQLTPHQSARRAPPDKPG